MTPEERSSIDNGIWLCATCATRIDTDEVLFPVERLRRWKLRAELKAMDNIGKPRPAADAKVAVPSVVSYNQSGGQTALSITNYERPARKLAGRTVQPQFVRRMRNVGQVTIVAYSTDLETHMFARDVSLALAMLGVDTNPDEPAMVYGPPPTMLEVWSTATDPANDPLSAFAEWLQSEGFEVAYRNGEKFWNSVHIPPPR